MTVDRNWYDSLAKAGKAGELLAAEVYQRIFTNDKVELLLLLDAAFQVRRKFHGREVEIHIINNVRNGLCSEDCNYCAQSRSSRADIVKYTSKSDQEILAEAEQAHEAGAHRYCMVYSGRNLCVDSAKEIASIVRKIKEKYPLEVCVSAGIMDEATAKILQEAGLDRLNHNLNTSAAHYSNICTTHSFADRVNTLKAARRAGLEVCSGIIAGMGETTADLIELAMTLRELDARSIPVNFLLPIEGNVLSEPANLNPDLCLKILCLFRFINPAADIRVAAGRELHLRGMEALSLYPANSLFMDGYLNTKGDSRLRTLQMIDDAGFTIRADKSLADVLNKELASGRSCIDEGLADSLKSLADLRPYHNLP